MVCWFFSIVYLYIFIFSNCLPYICYFFILFTYTFLYFVIVYLILVIFYMLQSIFWHCLLEKFWCFQLFTCSFWVLIIVYLENCRISNCLHAKMKFDELLTSSTSFNKNLQLSQFSVDINTIEINYAKKTNDLTLLSNQLPTH